MESYDDLKKIPLNRRIDPDSTILIHRLPSDRVVVAIIFALRKSFRSLQQATASIEYRSKTGELNGRGETCLGISVVVGVRFQLKLNLPNRVEMRGSP